jgi:hypothetical protein
MFPQRIALSRKDLFDAAGRSSQIARAHADAFHFAIPGRFRCTSTAQEYPVQKAAGGQLS